MKTGPNIVTDGLVFALDGYSNVRGFSKFGTSGTNDSHRAIRNLVNTSFTSSLADTSQLTGGNYFTLYGLTYPESSQTPASRHGITAGFNNTSATKLYSHSRDLGYYVFDESTNTWVADSYFNGERISGHVYDTYDGEPDQHQKFQDDYDVIKEQFPNATHIVIGSHAAENVDNDTDTVTRLKEIGLPDSHTGLGRNEFVLVGKVNKPHTHHYVRNNVSTAVAHMNLRLPLEGLGGSMVFDGTDDKIAAPWPSDLDSDDNTTPRSWEVVLKTTSTSRQGVFGHKSGAGCSYYCNGGIFLYGGNVTFNWYDNSAYQFLSGGSITTNKYMHVVGTFDGNAIPRIYVNGELKATYGSSTNLNYSSGMNIYDIGWNSKNSGTDYFNGEIPIVKYYKDKALSLSEVKQNYNAYKKRFGI